MSQDLLSNIQQQLLNSGRFYEFEQNIKTKIFRHKSKKEFQKAIELCYQACVILIEKQQKESSESLAQLFIQLFTEGKQEVVVEMVLSYALKMFMVFPNPQKFKFMNQILQIFPDQNNQMMLEVHQQIAQAYEDCNNPPLAHLHYLLTKNIQKQFQTWQKIVNKGFPSEYGLFTSRSVLLLVNTKRVDQAKAFLGEVLSSGILGSQTLPPEVQFCEIVIDAIQTNVLEKKIGEMLKEKYSPFFQRDPKMQKLFEAVLKTYFELEIMSGNFLENLFKGLNQ